MMELFLYLKKKLQKISGGWSLGSIWVMTKCITNLWVSKYPLKVSNEKHVNAQVFTCWLIGDLTDAYWEPSQIFKMTLFVKHGLLSLTL